MGKLLLHQRTVHQRTAQKVLQVGVRGWAGGEQVLRASSTGVAVACCLHSLGQNQAHRTKVGGTSDELARVKVAPGAHFWASTLSNVL